MVQLHNHKEDFNDVDNIIMMKQPMITKPTTRRRKRTFSSSNNSVEDDVNAADPAVDGDKVKEISKENINVMRVVALFLDGMSRSAIFPFGPSLIYRLVVMNDDNGIAGFNKQKATTRLGLDCAKSVYCFAIVVAAYLLGRGFGTSLAQSHNLIINSTRIRIISKPSHNNNNNNNKRLSTQRFVARLAGIAIALHVFTFGAGLQSVWWLVMIRFISAVLVGILCVVTKDDHDDKSRDHQDEDYLTTMRMTRTPEDRLESGDILNNHKDDDDDTMMIRDETQQRRHNGYVDFASITAKTYMTAFSISILTGGLFYRHATGDATFRNLTGSKQFTLSPLFLIGLSLSAESILRCVFAFFSRCNDDDDIPAQHQQQQTKSPSRSRTKSVGREDHYDTSIGGRSYSVDSEGFAPCRERLGSSPSYKNNNNNNLSPYSPPPSGHNSDEGDMMEFFDCSSVLSDMEDVDVFEDALLGDYDGGSHHRNAVYKNKRCLYPNGEPAYVPNGDSPDIVPANYLKLCGGDEIKAEKMWRATQEWRRKQGVWKIHSMPNKWFTKIKAAYPHFIHGYSKKGYIVVYEQPGKMKLKQLFRDGCKVSDMVSHYIFFLEYISNHICAKPDVRKHMGVRPPPLSSSTWNLLVVMDVKGAGLSCLSQDVVSYLSKAGDINNSHYPLSMKRAFLVNSPFWLAGAWKSVKGILPDSVQVDILSSHQYLKVLREYIDDDQIPRDYGGSSPYKLGEHPFEEYLYRVVEEANDMGSEEAEDFDIEEIATTTRPQQEKTVSESTAYSSYYDYSNKETKGAEAEDPHPLIEDSSTTWNNDLTINSSISSSGLHARRRRVSPNELHEEHGSFKSSHDDFHDHEKKGSGGETDIFVIVSIIYGLWSAIQGIIETTIPLWILIPPAYGGLGYAPSRSGVAMFCSTIVLLWIMRTNVSKVISKKPGKAPMQSFRIGVGAESVLLLLLATIPKTVGPEKRVDNVLVMAITVLVLSFMVLFSLLGRASSTILHRIACESFARRETKPKGWFSEWYGVEQLLCDCRNGKITTRINFVSEIVGVLAIAPICSWSLEEERPTPFDGTCCLFICCLMALVLYVFSFSLHLNVIGEFAPHPRGEGCGDVRDVKKCAAFLCEIFAVSVNDMTSLFEETNWSLSSPLLAVGNYTRGNRRRGFLRRPYHHRSSDEEVEENQVFVL